MKKKIAGDNKEQFLIQRLISHRNMAANVEQFDAVQARVKHNYDIEITFDKKKITRRGNETYQ